MLKNILLFFITVSFLSSPTFGAEEAPAAPTSGPALELKTYLEELFDFSKKVNSEKADELNQAREKIGSSLDWEKVAEGCVGAKTWKKQSSGNRESFKKLLKDVILRTAYTRLDKFWLGGTTYLWEKLDVQGDEATAISKFTVKKERFEVVYYLHKTNTWFIQDIAYEGERYGENINQQISGFLKEHSFPDLLEKLKRRKQELISSESKKS